MIAFEDSLIFYSLERRAAGIQMSISRASLHTVDAMSMLVMSMVRPEQAPPMLRTSSPTMVQSFSSPSKPTEVALSRASELMRELRRRADQLQRRSMERMFRKQNGKPNTAGHLILLRHGESLWNDNNRFTGWANVDLTDVGRQQAREAAELLVAEPDLQIDVCYTSVLRRSIETAEICLDEWEQAGRQRPDVQARWRLNERHYGALTGLNKREALQTMEPMKLREWRSSFQGRPPPMEPDHPHYSRTPERYQRLMRSELGGGRAPASCDEVACVASSEPPLQLDDLPLTESLADTRERVRTFWLDELQPTVLEGKTVLVVGHANCLRALISCIQTNIRDENLPSLGVPNALPLVYSFDESGRPLSELEGKCYIPPMDAHYLGDSCYVFNALSGAGELPPEADNNGDGVVDFNEYMSWESRLRAARPGVGVGRGDGGGGSSASRIRG